MRKIYSSPPKHVLLNMFMRFFLSVLGRYFLLAAFNESLKELEEPIENVNYTLTNLHGLNRFALPMECVYLVAEAI